jgi:uncharacterized protein YggE
MSRLGVVSGALMLALLLMAGGLLAYLIPIAGRAPVASVVAQTAGGPPSITVTSEGSASAQPDRATISVGVQATRPTAAEALAEANRATEAILAKLDEFGIPRTNVQTSGISLFPVQEGPSRPGGEPTISDYRAVNQVTVVFDDLGKVGQVLDGVVAAGANQVSGVRFGIKDDSGLQAQAMQQAVQKSRPQADAIAAGLGLKTDQVLAIREDPSSGPVVPVADAAQRGGGVPIEPGQLTARVRVQVTFALVPAP